MARRRKRSLFNARTLTCEALDHRRVLATFTVTTTTDFLPGSFRDAIQQANANPGTDWVKFSPALVGQTSYLEGAAIDVTDSIVIDGIDLNGDHRIHADGNPGILRIQGQGLQGITVSIRNLTFDGSIQDTNSPPETFPAVIKSDQADLILNRVHILNTLGPGPDYSEPTSAVVASGDLVNITFRDSIISGNGGGAQLANRNAVLFDVGFYSNVKIERTQIVDSVSFTRGLEAYLYEGSELQIIDSSISRNSEGGAVVVAYDSEVAIRDSVFAANDALYGPGLGLSLNSSSAETANNTVAANEKTGFWILAAGNSNATSQGDRITDHDATGYYAAAAATFSSLGASSIDISGATITGNINDTDGGSLRAFATDSASLVVRDSLISNNESLINGGGLYLKVTDSANAEISNSTISGNTSANSGGGLAIYAITSPSESVRLEHLTVTENESPFGGGGLYVPYFIDEGAITLANSIIANNLGSLNNDVLAQLSPLSSYNLIGNGYGSNLSDGVLGNQIGTVASPIDPQLEPLADNGGLSLTHALSADSPAFNAGDPGIVDPPSTDQRGAPFIREAFGRIDVGAYEFYPNISGDFDGDGTWQCDDIDALVAAIVSGSTAQGFDLNADGGLNLDDVAAWLAQAAAERGLSDPLLFGDANLDGLVDGVDFIVWNSNKFTPTAAWCAGDFNADGITDASDFIIWNDNKFQTVVIGSRSSGAFSTKQARTVDLNGDARRALPRQGEPRGRATHVVQAIQDEAGRSANRRPAVSPGLPWLFD